MLACLQSSNFPMAAHHCIPSQYILSLVVLVLVRLTSLIINLFCKLIPFSWGQGLEVEGVICVQIDNAEGRIWITKRKKKGINLWASRCAIFSPHWPRHLFQYVVDRELCLPIRNKLGHIYMCCMINMAQKPQRSGLQPVIRRA